MTDQLTSAFRAVALVASLLLLSNDGFSDEHAPGVAASRAEIIALTSKWTGERSADGRPHVSDELLRRMKKVSAEEAWDVLRLHGYEKQFESGWKMLHPEMAFVGRALTANYMPSRPDLDQQVRETGEAEGRIGPPNSWPIDMLQQGDVYVAAGYGKVTDGTLMGDNLGNSIYAKSGTGVVFDAGSRDLAGLKKISGFNAFVRGWDPSIIKNMLMTSINRPIRIGGITVLPGDVILANEEGVTAIPAHLAEEVVVTAEIVSLKDAFGHARLREGVYTPGQIDTSWSAAIKADFFRWLESYPNKPPISRAELEEHLDRGSL